MYNCNTYTCMSMCKYRHLLICIRRIDTCICAYAHAHAETYTKHNKLTDKSDRHLYSHLMTTNTERSHRMKRNVRVCIIDEIAFGNERTAK